MLRRYGHEAERGFEATARSADSAIARSVGLRSPRWRGAGVGIECTAAPCSPRPQAAPPSAPPHALGLPAGTTCRPPSAFCEVCYGLCVLRRGHGGRFRVEAKSLWLARPGLLSLLCLRMLPNLQCNGCCPALPRHRGLNGLCLPFSGRMDFVRSSRPAIPGYAWLCLAMPHQHCAPRLEQWPIWTVRRAAPRRAREYTRRHDCPFFEGAEHRSKRRCGQGKSLCDEPQTRQCGRILCSQMKMTSFVFVKTISVPCPRLFLCRHLLAGPLCCTRSGGRKAGGPFESHALLPPSRAGPIRGPRPAGPSLLSSSRLQPSGLEGVQLRQVAWVWPTCTLWSDSSRGVCAGPS